MRKLLLFLTGLFLFSASTFAAAGVPVLKWQTGWEVSPISAGAAHVAQHYPYHTVVRSFVLPGTEIVVGATRSRAEFWLCPLGQARLNPAMEMCEEGQPDLCAEKLGTSTIVNVTSGWKRTPKVNDDTEEWVYTYRFPPSNVATVCGGTAICEMTIDWSEPCSECRAFVSQVPAANGLYRTSTDFRGHFTGKTCTSASSSDLPPEALSPDDSKDPPCPGYVGEVNGVRGCYGNASNPVRPVPQPPKSPAHGEGDTGNPAAGTKPSSGEGSGSDGAGRTPSAGTGGSAGGPSGAAAGSGTKPDGTTPKPGDGKEQAACGAPGQPKCGIDEGGTPSKFDGDKAAFDKWKSDMESNRNTIKDANGGFFDSYNVFFAAPPFVPCEPIELPNEVLLTRQCDVVDGIRSVMAYIWALAALWICLGWIREAI